MVTALTVHERDGRYMATADLGEDSRDVGVGNTPQEAARGVNEAKTLLSRRGKRAQVEVVAGASDRAGGLDPATGIEMIDLLAALDRLDPDDRALLAMRYVAGFNATELAAALGISPSGTRTRLERLTARLREELA